MEEVFTDGYGNYYFTASGQPLTYFDLIARGIDVAGARLSRSPYISPDDPRYQRGNFPANFPQPGSANQTRTNSGDYIPGAVNDRGFQLNWWTAALIGVVVGSFLLGKKR
jgi:hypothetical protein